MSGSQVRDLTVTEVLVPLSDHPGRRVDEVSKLVAQALAEAGAGADPRALILGLALHLGRLVGRAGWSERGVEAVEQAFMVGRIDGRRPAS